MQERAAADRFARPKPDQPKGRLAGRGPQATTNAANPGPMTPRGHTVWRSSARGADGGSRPGPEADQPRGGPPAVDAGSVFLRRDPSPRPRFLDGSAGRRSGQGRPRIIIPSAPTPEGGNARYRGGAPQCCSKGLEPAATLPGRTCAPPRSGRRATERKGMLARCRGTRKTLPRYQVRSGREGINEVNCGFQPCCLSQRR
jgi:hypothetical protein